MNVLHFRLEGTSPLLLHNGILSDPLDPRTKAIAAVTKGRNKTDREHERVAELEFHGSLYLSEKVPHVPVLPADNLQKVLIEGARKAKLGKAFEAGTYVLADAPILYDGPKAIDKLYADERFRYRKGVVVQKRRVMRTRPIFRIWAVEMAVEFDPEQVNKTDVIEALTVAGGRVGIGDWRPRYGRFEAKVIKAKL